MLHNVMTLSQDCRRALTPFLAARVHISPAESSSERIAIARSILKNAPVVILNEATAFADPENEVLVQKAFTELTKHSTVIMIAHRLSTIRNADKIYVLDHGEVVEEGRHDELVEKGGIYSAMWKEYQSAVSWKVGEAV